jgi:hypothetical protein
MRTLNRWVVVSCALIVADVGVRADDQIRTYNVPKEQPTQLAAVDSGAPAATPDIPVNAVPVQFTLPDGWQQLAPDGIRLANLAVPGKNGGSATVAITSFPGEVGTELENVNRWRNQVGLTSAQATDITSQPVVVDGSEGKLYDISGTSARTVVVVIRRNGATWFIKMTGDIGPVTDARPAFTDFLKSIRLPNGGGATAVAATEAVDSTSPTWSVPPNWVKSEPGPMIFKSFTVGDNAGNNGAITVSFFPGDVGGALANVNRWRSQMELPPVEDINLNGLTENIDTLGGKGLLVDFQGTGSKSGKRLLAVIVPHGDNTWFYKLLGDNALVATEKDGFVNFVKNVHYP